jgi:hypothetical protein
VDPEVSQNVIVGIAGRRGCGKSTVARRILERCPRIVLWDPLGEHRWCPNELGSVGELERFLAWAEGRQTFAARCVVQWGDLEEEFDGVAELVYEYGDLVLGVEEVPLICTPGALPAGFDRLVRLGRHQRVSVLYTGQRLAEVARRLTAATDYFVLFRHSEPRDLDGIAERCGTEVAVRVSELSRHGSLVWDVVEGRECGFERVVDHLVSLSRGLSQQRSVTGGELSSVRQVFGKRAR